MSAVFDHEWLPLPESAGHIIGAARFAEDSAWFSGHFPGNPIVPGVALIALVADAVIRRESGAGRPLAVTGVRRVRFRLPVRPGDEVTLSATEAAGPGGPSFAFCVFLAGEPACSGVLATKRIAVKTP
jgi:3-hydroxymyristoyl/3-hydroxydecanoyl-(acyl carrier protein) dehydratase